MLDVNIADIPGICRHISLSRYFHASNGMLSRWQAHEEISLTTFHKIT